MLKLTNPRFARRNFGWTGIAKKQLAIFNAVKQRRKEDLV